MSVSKYRVMLTVFSICSRNILASASPRGFQIGSSRLLNRTANYCNNVTNTQSLPNTVEVKMKIAFTCKICDTRNEKMFSKLAYTKGVVIITCDGCGNRHLIADNLDWFTDHSKKNIEDFLAEKNMTVQRSVPILEVLPDEK